MDDERDKVPQPVSIQTGNTRVQYIGLREDRQDLSEFDNISFDHIPGPEPDHCSVEAFQPPPIQEDEPQPYGGGWAHLDSPQNIDTSEGVKFDPSSNMDSMKQVRQYHIIDLFWLINPNFGNPEISQDQAHFCQISFNIDFGNLKITLNKIPNGAIHGHVMFLNALKRLTSGTIYPASCFNLINKHQHSQEDNDETFTCLEQLIQKTGEDWQKKRPMSVFTINKNLITLTINDPYTGSFFYPFRDWQLEALLHSAKFATSKGYLLTGRIISKE